MRLGQKIPTSFFISNQTLMRQLIELFVRLLDFKKLLIILAGLGLRNRDFVYRFLSHRHFYLRNLNEYQEASQEASRRLLKT